MPTLSNPELAEALEGANSLILRWGHNQMRQLKAEEVERIVAALKASASSETGPRKEWLVTFSENGEEYTGHMVVKAGSFRRDPDDVKVFFADGVRVELDEHIMEVCEAPSGERG